MIELISDIDDARSTQGDTRGVFEKSIRPDVIEEATRHPIEIAASERRCHARWCYATDLIIVSIRDEDITRRIDGDAFGLIESRICSQPIDCA